MRGSGVIGSRAGRGVALGLAIAVFVGAEVRPEVEGKGFAAATLLPPVVAELEPVLAVSVDSSVFGRSGVLRVVQAMPEEAIRLPLRWDAPRPDDVWYRWNPVTEGNLAGKAAPRPLGAGDEALAPADPGVYRLEVGGAGDQREFDEFTLIVKVPFRAMEGGYLKGYLIGRYPRTQSTGPYAPPEGFIEVTPENRDLPLSEHFTLGEFLTKNQHNVWPKYVVVDMKLIDKLELVLQDLNARGIRADDMVIMSGYRTPQYNAQGVGRGRASLSRHQYGDAADVWVENDGDWYMDDLNGDGRKDTGDARVILESVDRVEARYPELVGGAGIYRANNVRGPFIHIDTRGKRARW